MAASVGERKMDISKLLIDLQRMPGSDDLVMHPVKFTQSLIHLEGRVSVSGAQIPQDYHRFLRVTNGATVYGNTLYGAKAVFMKYKKYSPSVIPSSDVKNYSGIWWIGEDPNGNDLLLAFTRKDLEAKLVVNPVLKDNAEGIEVVSSGFTEFLYSLLPDHKITKSRR